MAWFGETLGESFNSLKGQITKITKDVLAENSEGEDVSETENVALKLSELEALCESKDIEITSLRQENNQLIQQFQKKTEYLKKESQGKLTHKNFEFDDDHIQYICKLENELSQVKEEKEQLIKSLDAINNEHQKEIFEIVKVRDNYKHELTELKNANALHKNMVNENKNQNFVEAERFKELELQHNLDLEEIQLKEGELLALKTELHGLQLKVQADYKEREESCKMIKKEIVEHESIKVKLEKLVGEIKILTEDKHKTDAENKTLKAEMETLKENLEKKSIELDLLNKDNEKIQSSLNQCHKEKASENHEKTLYATKELLDVTETKFTCLLKNLQLNSFTEGNIFNLEVMNEYLDSINDKISSLILQKKESDIENQETIEKLKNEVDDLKSAHYNLENETKLRNEEWCKNEEKYKEIIVKLEAMIVEIKNQQQDCLIQRQTDDAKRLEQEVATLTSLLKSKDNELNEICGLKNTLEQELNIIKSLSSKATEELQTITKEKEHLEEELSLWKKSIQSKDEQFSTLHERNSELEKKYSELEISYSEITKLNSDLSAKLNEITTVNSKLSTEANDRSLLEENYSKSLIVVSQLENNCKQLEQSKNNLLNELENFKAQLIIKDSNLAEVIKNSSGLETEYKELKSEVKRLTEIETEANKWKNASVDLEVQRQALVEEKEQLEKEYLRLKDIEKELQMNHAEMTKLKEAYSSLLSKHEEILTAPQASKSDEMTEYSKENRPRPSTSITHSDEEVQKIQSDLEDMKVIENQDTRKENLEVNNILEHRRTKSAVDFNAFRSDLVETSKETEQLKLALQQEQSKFRQLQNEHTELKEKETNARRELERLRIHLVEVEDHYTSEAVESERTISDFKTKLNNAEEQLKNSSTIYKSANVRANQHLESLQSQIRLISFQRDDLQAKLSAAEDEVQRHSASLTNLQMVLEQFQQDKEREIEAIVTKYEYQLQLSNRRFKELESEIESLKKQLSEAKNGLNAASRLGEQLEKKSQQVTTLEASLAKTQQEIKDVENQLAIATQSVSGKIDKSLIKNLVIGYITFNQPDRRLQVLRIMSSLLDFNQEERAKTAVDSSQGGWLSSILHPKGENSGSTQSLSEAFIRFLESESRPQPQLKLLAEQSQSEKSPASGSSSKSLLLSELVLPTFSPSNSNESCTILKDVLKDNS